MFLKYIFLFGISSIVLLVVLVVISIIFGLFIPGCQKETFGNFHPYFWTNVKLIPFVHSNYNDPSYTRENLLKGLLPSDPNTLYMGISLHDKNTVHKYIINHLIKKIVLHHTKQILLLDIDYQHDYQVLQDLNDNKIQYGLVSTPVISAYLHKVPNIQFITTLTHSYVYGITMANRGIYNIKDAKDMTVGISKDYATEWIVSHDMIEGLNCKVYECKDDHMLDRLKDGLIDMYFIIAAYPSDRVRWLLNKNRDVRLVDMDRKVDESKYEKVLLSQKLIEYYQRDLYSHDGTSRYLPLNTPAGSYNDYDPYINSYKFANCFLTNTANQVDGHYQVIRDIYHKMYNNRRVGLGYLPNKFLSKHIKLGVTHLPIPIHPAVKDFHDNIANDQLNI